MSRKAVVILAVLAIAAVAVPLAASTMVPDSFGSASLKRFTSYYQVLNFIQTSTSSVQGYDKVFRPYLSTSSAPAMFAGAASSIASAPAYSTTNVQVAGVDEADIVKTDGTYLYVVRGYYGAHPEVDILQAYPVSAARLLSRLNWTSGHTPTQLFINGDRLVVFVSSYTSTDAYSPSTEVDVFNIKDRTSPVLVRNVTVDGSYVGSRMISSFVYVVTSSPAYVQSGVLKLPSIGTGASQREVAASDIYYSDEADYSYAFTTVLSVDASNDLAPYASQTILMGTTSIIYVSTNAIYLAISGYGPVSTLAGGLARMPMMPVSVQGGNTVVYKVSIGGGKIDANAEGTVQGSLLNQFSLDEYNGYLRVATTSYGSNGQVNNVYVLDPSMAVVGKLEGMAPGEKIYSTRFLGNLAYVVTFEKVDPLFIINMTDPTNPFVLGWLKTPGFSDYLQPMDAGHLLGVGKEAIPAEQGTFAWYQGMKLSIFDVTNVTNPLETSTYNIGDRGTTSPALTDQKAILYDPTSGLLVIPVTVYKVDASQYGGNPPASAYGSPVWQGAYVFNVSVGGGIVLNGTITHIAGAYSMNSADYNLNVERALYIGSYLYTVSNGLVMVNNLQGLSQVASIALP